MRQGGLIFFAKLSMVLPLQVEKEFCKALACVGSPLTVSPISQGTRSCVLFTAVPTRLFWEG